jgi:hypothetical protein
MSQLETKRQNQVLVYLLEHAPVAEKAEIYYFSFEPEPKRRYYVAAAELVGTDPGLSLVFTLASHSNWVFLTITDAPPRKIAALFAELEDFASTEKPVDHSHTLRIESNALAEEHGRVAMLLLPASVSLYLPDFPAEIPLEGGACRSAFVAFLSADEYQTKLEHGFDALLDQFESKNRDLVTFGRHSSLP